ncbi:hypothetical protein [Flindersiella endophytica]
MTDSAEASMRPELLTALIEEAGKKSSVLWLTYSGSQRARPAWHVWLDGAAYVVAAGADESVEQPLPGLADVTSATVTMRAKDARSRLVSWEATVSRVEAGSEEWAAATKSLRAERLNAVESATLPDQWAASAVVVRLRPTGEVPEHPGRMPSDEAAARPPETPATTQGRLPWVIHRRPTKARKLS